MRGHMQGQVLKYHIFVLLMLLHVFCFTASAQVDWEKGTVRATGMGLPSPDMPEVQAKLLAKRAAMSDAYRKLAEVVQGVQVTSETIVKNFVTESDEIHTKVQAFIKGALVVDEKQNEDGSYEVTLEAPIYGVGSLADMLLNEAAKKSVQYTYMNTDGSLTGEYTGLVIDARGIPFVPSLAPRVFNTLAEIIYDITMVEPSDYNKGIVALIELSQDEGIVAGDGSIHKVLSEKVGSKPLVVNAVDHKNYGGPVAGLPEGDLVVSTEDALKLGLIKPVKSFSMASNLGFFSTFDIALAKKSSLKQLAKVAVLTGEKQAEFSTASADTAFEGSGNAAGISGGSDPSGSVTGGDVSGTPQASQPDKPAPVVISKLEFIFYTGAAIRFGTDQAGTNDTVIVRMAGKTWQFPHKTNPDPFERGKTDAYSVNPQGLTVEALSGASFSVVAKPKEKEADYWFLEKVVVKVNGAVRGAFEIRKWFPLDIAEFKTTLPK